MSSDALTASIREAFGRVVWTHKTHEKAIDRLNLLMLRLKSANVFLLVLTTGGVVSSILGTGKMIDCLTALFSALALGTSVYQRSFNPAGSIAAYHPTSNLI